MKNLDFSKRFIYLFCFSRKYHIWCKTDEIRNNNEIEMDIVTCTVLLKIYGLTFNNKTIERIDNLLDEMKKKM